MDIYDAALRYVNNGHSLIILAGKDYGSGMLHKNLMVAIDLLNLLLLRLVR